MPTFAGTEVEHHALAVHLALTGQPIGRLTARVALNGMIVAVLIALSLGRIVGYTREWRLY